MSCATFVIGPVTSLIPEWSADAPRSLFDVGAEPTAHIPVPAIAAMLDGWSSGARDEIAHWGVIDVVGCAEAQTFYALAALPVVIDEYAAQAPRDAFLSVIHVDYGSVSVADDRLFPIRHPASECFGQAAAAFDEVVYVSIEPIGGVDVVVYRTGAGDSVRAIIADDTGRAVLVTGARATDMELHDLAEQLAAPLRSGTT